MEQWRIQWRPWGHTPYLLELCPTIVIESGQILTELVRVTVLTRGLDSPLTRRHTPVAVLSLLPRVRAAPAGGAAGSALIPRRIHYD
ncbi:hypothetical protein EVAR_30866_1 [Eumeta japonica]|uniref:Uncharacterized protein n=1 Tax=Eumeta variegata TaxID=151549 RepID=A0A4C1V391_EUMVA|nr:hypothetical protein EVAR_30866_1 [Eumeta japonica]